MEMIDPHELEMALPSVVNSILQRQYLSNNEEILSKVFKPSIQGQSFANLPVMTRISSLGRTEQGRWEKVAHAIQRAVTGCYMPNEFQLYFLVEFDGNSVHIYLGLRSFSFRRDAEEYLTNFTAILTSECPGTKFEKMSDEQRLFEARKLCMPITGIPANLLEQTGALETLLTAMNGMPFSLLIIADPMMESEIEQALYACREMQSMAETLKTISVTNSKNWTEQFSQQYSETQQETMTLSKSVSKKDFGDVLKMGAIGLGITLLAPELAPLMLMGSAMFSPTNTEGISNAQTHGHTFTQGYSVSQGTSSGTTVNVVNAHLIEATNYLKKFSDRLASGKLYGMWKTSVYFCANKPKAIDRGSMIIKALYTGEDSYVEPIRTHPNFNGLKSEVLKKSYTSLSFPHWEMFLSGGKRRAMHPLGEAFSSISTPLTSMELMRWLDLPHRDIPGFSISSSAEGFSANSTTNVTQKINLGTLKSSTDIGESFYAIPPDSLTRHALLAGMTRQGKSNTCQQLLQELIRIKGSDFPFMVIEPAKTEYVDWALRINNQAPGSINIFMPGRTTYCGHNLSPLKLNPFEVIWENPTDELRIAEHIQHLTTIINASLPMQESLPLLMEEAIYSCYADYTFVKDKTNSKSDRFQWLSRDNYLWTKPAPWGAPFPTFKTLLQYAKATVKKKKYSTQSNASLMAALDTRIGSFLHPGLSKYESFYTDGTANPTMFKQLFSSPTIINLSAVGDENEKAFFMAIILMYLYEYRCHQAIKIGYANELRHLLILEEAHCVLQKSATAIGMESIDTMGKVSNMFSNMISEIGAYGQGIMIVDQSPEKLSTDAIKNTNLKIVHRLTYGNDKEQMGIALDLSNEQERMLSGLSRGEAIIRSDDDDKPSLVQIHLAKQV